MKLIFLIFFIHSVVSQETLSLAQAEAIALKQNLGLQIKKIDNELSSKDLWQGYMNFAPTITLDHSLVRLNDYNLFVQSIQTNAFKELLKAMNLNSIADQIPNTAFRNLYRSSLTANWNLFAKGMALKELSRRKVMEQISELEISEEEKNTIYKVRESYLQLFVLQEIQKINNERILSMKQRVEQVQKLVNGGIKSNSELLRWQIQLNQTDERVFETNNLLKMAEYQFSDVLGLEKKQHFTLVHSIESQDELFADLSEEKLFQLSSDSIYALVKSKRLLEIAENNKFYSYGKFLPSIDIRWTKNWQQSDFAFPAEQPGEISLNFSWELFSSFKDYMQLEKDELEIQKAELQHQDIIKNTKRLLLDLYFQLEKSRKSIKSSKNSMDLANENHRIVKNRYETGLSSNLELLDSEIQLFDSKIDYLTQWKNYLLFGYKLQSLLK